MSFTARANRMTTAFVLSGGASLGPIQVGILQALAERRIKPALFRATRLPTYIQDRRILPEAQWRPPNLRSSATSEFTHGSHDCLSLTAKMTAKSMHAHALLRTLTECLGRRSNCSGPRWTSADGRPAVFKTVGGTSIDVHSRSRTSTTVHWRRRLTANDSQVWRRESPGPKEHRPKPAQGV